MSTTPVLSANFSGLTTEINRVFSVMSGKTPVLSGPIGATGPAGATGPRGITGPAGPIGIGIGTTLKGVWTPGGTYGLNSGSPDAVTYNGSFYVCIQAVSGSTVTPDQDITNWLRYVQQGVTGPTGIQGTTGPSGATGIGIGTTLQGTWTNGATYRSRNGVSADAVTYNGSFFVCIQSVPFVSTIPPDVDTANWLLYVKMGVTGATGTISAVGSDGQFLYNSGGTLAASAALTYRATGPTGPAGQATGPIGQPTLQVGAYVLPTTDATYDLGATGIQFKDVHFSGTIYNNGSVFQGGVSGLTYRATGPTGPQGQATGPAPSPTLQVGAYLVPTTDATYDLGATGIQFKDVHFSGTIYNNGVPFSGGGGGITAPTDNFMVAAGQANNRLAYSYDGITWTRSANGDSIITGVCKAVAWNGSLWVAGGQGTNKLVYSSDGITWTGSTNGNSIITGVCNAVAWNGFLWVAGSTDGNKLAYSYDGITWYGSTNGNSVISGSTTAVAWNGSLWVAGSYGGGYNPLAYSYDGITWYASTNGISIITTTCAAVAWNGSIWVAGGTGDNGNRLAYSYDGITWYASTSGTSIFTDICNAVAWNGSLWVAGGTGTNTLAYSYDGITWYASTSGTSIIVTSCTAVAWNGSLWVAGGQGTNTLAYSYDGITWAASASGSSIIDNTCYAVASRRPLPFVGAGGSTPGLYYRASGPTGPTGQATGPIGPWLQLSANIVPTQDLAYDLGATGLRFRDLYVGGTSIHIGDNVTISSTNDGLSVANQNNSVSIVETIDVSIPEINSDLVSFVDAFNNKLHGPILTVANSSNGTYISIGYIYSPLGVPNNLIAVSNNAGITTSNIYNSIVGSDGPIASIAMTPSGQRQVAVFGAKAPWPNDGFTGPIISSSNYGAEWAALNTDSSPKRRQYTSASISSDGARIVATHLISGSKSSLVNPGFVYTVNALAETPDFSKVTSYTPPGAGSAINFTAPRFVNIYQDGTRFIIMDVRTSAGKTDVICFNMTSEPPACLIKFVFNSLNVLVSNLTSNGFTVLYNEGSSGSWAHTFKRYDWSVSANTPTLNSTKVVYSDTTNTGILDLQLLCSADGITQIILPTYTSSAINITNGLYISNNRGTSWRFLDNASEGIVTNSTTNIASIALTASNIYRFLYNSGSLITKLYKTGQKYIVKNGADGLNYLPFGPTGPIGPTGPTGPTLRMTANLVPSTTAIYDLGATGIQFKDIHFSGSLYNNGVPFSGGGGITAPTDNFMVAGGDGAGIAYSYDGTSWTSVTEINIAGCTAVAWNGSIWVAGITTSAQTIAYSSDGIKWFLLEQSILASCLAVAWNGSIWVAGGTSTSVGNEIIYSYEGINWLNSAVNPFSEGACNAIAWNGNIWVAVGVDDADTGLIAYSLDGINWINTNDTLYPGPYTCVAWNGKIWVAGAAYYNSNPSMLAYSYDGIKWYNSGQTVVNANVFSVAWNGSMWLAGGEQDSGENQIAYSFDGITWISTGQTIIISQCNTVAWNGSVWIAGGTSNGSTKLIYGSYNASSATWTWAESNYTGFTNSITTIASRRVLPFVGTGGSTPGLYYRASGPTGPLGQATGPIGPWLQLSANIVPTQDLTYDLGATGLRFRDIHVGGSTIYLGDSVSIKADNQGALSVTNNAGTVNLVSPSGFNGGILSGVGVASNGSEPSCYGDHVFSSPFAYPPIVVASINNVTFITANLCIPKDTVTTTGCRVYSDTNGATYSWIATARTDYPFGFYNSAQPVSDPTVGYTTIVFQINTNHIVRTGTPPYTASLNMTSPSTINRTININTGMQTITFSALTIGGTQYTFNVTAHDSISNPITSDDLVYNTLTDNLTGLMAENIISAQTITPDTFAAGEGSIPITLTSFDPADFVDTEGAPPYSVSITLTYKGVSGNSSSLLDTWEPNSTTRTFTGLYPGLYAILYTLTDLYTSITPPQTILDITVDGPTALNPDPYHTVILKDGTGNIVYDSGSGGSVTFTFDTTNIEGGVPPYKLYFDLFEGSELKDFTGPDQPITTGNFTLSGITGSANALLLRWYIEDTGVNISSPVQYIYESTSADDVDINDIYVYEILRPPTITFFSKTTTSLTYNLELATGGSGTIAYMYQYRKTSNSQYINSSDSNTIEGLEPNTEYIVRCKATDDMTGISVYSGTDTQTTNPLYS